MAEYCSVGKDECELLRKKNVYSRSGKKLKNELQKTTVQEKMVNESLTATCHPTLLSVMLYRRLHVHPRLGMKDPNVDEAFDRPR